MKHYQRCIRCVIDTTDPDIEFDEHGVCNHCHYFDHYASKIWKKGKEGDDALEEMWAEIKKEGRNKEYDCILGLSGGIDSSYLLYLSQQAGLRVLAVHVDAGWNSEIAVHNIQALCSKLDVDLVTDVINWAEMQKLQRAFLRSRVINQDIPQDHAFFASLYKYAIKNKIKYVLNGANISSESILPDTWRGYTALDAVHIKDIFRKNCIKGERLNDFPLIHIAKHVLYYPHVIKMRMVSPLNFVDYDKYKAIAELQDKFGFRNPGEKHYESRFTSFHQRYNLFEKFGVDERKAHYSSLILAGQMTREEALQRLERPPYSSEIEKQRDIGFICSKLNFSREEFDAIMALSNGKHEHYKSSQVWFFKILPALIKIKRAILLSKK